MSTSSNVGPVLGPTTSSTTPATSSPPPSPTSAASSTPPPTSPATSVSNPGPVTGGGSSSASTTGSTPAGADAANVCTLAEGPPLSLTLPSEVIACAVQSFGFTGPRVPKTIGVFVENAQSQGFLELFALPALYNNVTSGSFTWTCDMPSSLRVAFEILYTSETGLCSFTTDFVTIQPGTTDSCLARNAGQNTQSINSYASSLNPSYTYTPPLSSGNTSNVSAGAIAGGVVGGLSLIAIVTFLLVWMQRRSQRRIDASMYGGSEYGDSRSPTEKPHEDRPRLVSGLYNPGVPEPMQSPHSPPQDSSRGHGRAQSGGVVDETMSTADYPLDDQLFARGPKGDDFRGTEGLDDPGSFSPVRMSGFDRSRDLDGRAVY